MPLLDLSVDLLSGTFHGESWPPAPARLYQALLAGARYRFRRGMDWKPEFEEAFRWLERQSPPTIVAPLAVRGNPYRIFGPDNDMDLVVTQWINASMGRPSKTPQDPTELRSEIVRCPWYVQGTVHYLYSVQEAPAAALREMAHSLVALGHGIDLAAGALTLPSEDEANDLPGERWTPMQGSHGLGTGLHIPAKGWYDRLEANYQAWRLPPSAHGDMDVRSGSVPPSLRPFPYQSSLAPPPRPFLAFTLQGVEEGTPHFVDWESAMEIAARLRHTTSEVFRSDGADESTLRIYVLGHGADQERDQRLSYVPLPSIGHRNADGRVRRALLTGPPGDERVKELATLMDGARLVAPGKPTSRLIALTGDDPVLDRYVRSSRSWASVTPVILHGHDARKRRVDPEKTHSLLVQALEQAGVGRAVASFAYRRAPWWPGTGSSRDIRVPAHLAPWPRYHLKVEFRTEIRGPFLVGIGRHYGIGLLAAT